MTNFFETHRAILWAVVFTFAVLITAPGIGNQSGPTSKDEYHRVVRTALTMIEENVWLVPILDGNPRIEKPPLLNWLTRWNFERFGFSLRSGRSIVVSRLAISRPLVFSLEQPIDTLKRQASAWVLAFEKCIAIQPSWR